MHTGPAQCLTPCPRAGFIPYTGDGFALLLPSKWNPSKLQDFKGTVLCYEDNGDAVNNLVVIKVPAKGTSVEQYGTPDAFLSTLQGMGLFGKQAYVGELPFFLCCRRSCYLRYVRCRHIAAQAHSPPVPGPLVEHVGPWATASSIYCASHINTLGKPTVGSLPSFW